MTAQQVLPMSMTPGAVRVGAAADLVEDGLGGEVFLHGNLTYAWSGQDQVLRRLTAVQLVELQVAKVGEVADAFGVDTATLWRWRRDFAGTGVGGLAANKRGPKGASKLTSSVIADIRVRRQGGASLRAVAAATGLSTGSVRRALTSQALDLDAGHARGDAQDDDAQVLALVVDLPVLAVPAARTGDRVA
ncbi:MAG: helix-turn-helix domain-containing protein, partial [Cellulomonas sp.]|uniref:helix-turn-helix domain-containing protein n=1 Tax=Cellulomonas sp. TaxID=40001 RepID=UPI00180CABE0